MVCYNITLILDNGQFNNHDTFRFWDHVKPGLPVLFKSNNSSIEMARPLERGTDIYMLSRTFIDIAIFIIFFVVLFVEILVSQKTNLEIEGLDKKITVLQKFRSEGFKNLEERLNSIRETLFEKVNPLNINLNELSKRTDDLFEKYNSILQEIDRKVAPLQTSFDDALAGINSSQEAMSNALKEGEKEIKKMTESIDAFREEIRKIKDFIRERTIDLEL